jgi:hypothetical protein
VSTCIAICYRSPIIATPHHIQPLTPALTSQFLYPEGSPNPVFDPGESTYHWYLKADGYRAQQRDLHECVIRPGEALYFPGEWRHAVLNKADYNAFVSTFT